MRQLRVSLLSVLSFAAAACATTVTPNELVTARTAYTAAAAGPAAQLDPAQLHEAHEGLTAAEQAFASEGDTFRVRDLAYIATRQAQRADARARTIEYDQEVNLAQRSVELTEAQQAAATTGALQQSQQQLATEEKRLSDAEKRTQQALAELAQVAAVKQDVRGTVITLSGGVLFESAKTTLMPTAQANLSQVADALTKTDPDSKITVSGFTDSQGGEAYNMDLSQRRADAVMAFLVGHGVAADRITARGFGPSQPVASNTTAEGRADNRRVEIVVLPKGQSASHSPLP
jgi:outer membrane protein OmpA-like peptidoglycan-associated protein